jgi:hypothetical protein
MSLLRRQFVYVAAALKRGSVYAPFFVGMFLVCAAPADAGIVTSMDAVACSSVEEASKPLARGADFRLILGFMLEQAPDLNHALPTSSSTTGSGAANGFGPMQLTAEFATVFDSRDMTARGWTSPEATLALPPLLPSGLFRPPQSC